MKEILAIFLCFGFVFVVHTLIHPIRLRGDKQKAMWVVRGIAFGISYMLISGHITYLVFLGLRALLGHVTFLGQYTFNLSSFEGLTSIIFIPIYLFFGFHGLRPIFK